jgi:hypothetical protein
LGEPGSTIFDLAIAAFAAVDASLPASLGPLARLIGWGFIMAVISMGLYRLVSPQRKIATLRREAAAARQQLATFDGEFEQLMPMVRRSLLLSLRQIGWIFFPALLASLPLVACLLWLESAYSFQAPAAGQQVAVTALPEGQRIHAQPPSALTHRPGETLLTWPRAGDTVTLLDDRGMKLATLGAGKPAADLIEPRRWWNAIIGNPLGYLPEQSAVARVEFAFQDLLVVGRKPAWYSGWMLPFFATLIVISLLIKVVFRIE